MRTLLFLFVVLFSFPAYAGGPEVGELFGYKLGEVYRPKQLQQDEIGSEVYQPEFIKDEFKKIGIESVYIIVYPKSYKAFEIVGVSAPLKWDMAKELAIKLAQEFEKDLGGQSKEKSEINELPLDPSSPSLIPPIEIYRHGIDQKFEVIVRLFQTYWDGRKPYVEVRFGYLEGSRADCESIRQRTKETPGSLNMALESGECDFIDE